MVDEKVMKILELFNENPLLNRKVDSIFREYSRSYAKVFKFENKIRSYFSKRILKLEELVNKIKNNFFKKLGLENDKDVYFLNTSQVKILSLVGVNFTDLTSKAFFKYSIDNFFCDDENMKNFIVRNLDFKLLDLNLFIVKKEILTDKQIDLLKRFEIEYLIDGKVFILERLLNKILKILLEYRKLKNEKILRISTFISEKMKELEKKFGLKICGKNFYYEIKNLKVEKLLEQNIVLGVDGNKLVFSLPIDIDKRVLKFAFRKLEKILRRL